MLDLIMLEENEEMVNFEIRKDNKKFQATISLESEEETRTEIDNRVYEILTEKETLGFNEIITGFENKLLEI